MGFQQPTEVFFFLDFELMRLHKLQVKNIFHLATKDVSKSAGHSRTKIQSDAAKNGDNSSGHVLTAVLAESFDDGDRAAIAHRESFTRLASDIKLAGSRPIQNRISNEYIAALGGVVPAVDNDRASGKAFADVVVGFSGEL